jgi:predicted DNA-binding transcriptional regulator AlpA
MTNPTTAPGARMLTVAEVCEQLGIKRTKFYTLVNRGELTAIDVNAAPAKRRVGERGPRRSIRIEQAVVDAFKARNQVPA